jgi:hypothetical protein
VLPSPDPALDDGVIRLRPWERRDLPCIRAAATDPRIPHRTTVPAVFSEEEGLAFIERQWRREGLLRSYLDGTLDVYVYSLIRSDLTP